MQKIKDDGNYYKNQDCFEGDEMEWPEPSSDEDTEMAEEYARDNS